VPTDGLSHPTGRLRVRSAFAAAVVIVVAAGVAAAGDDTTRTSSIFAPVSAPADSAYTAAMLVLAITAVIGVIVGGLLAYAVIAFRSRRDDDDSEPAQVYGSDQIELAWTVIPILVVVVLCLVTARTIYDVQGATAPPGALKVTVVGHQWWWELRYPDLGIVTANELHVPVSDPAHPTPTFLALESADVAHSFWVPRLAGKTDVIPNRHNRMWIDPREPGLFLGQCAEYCGTQHAHMLLRVYVHSRADFDRWVAAQRPPAASDGTVAAGRQVFETTACINCHTVRGTVATGRFGPDLTHLMSRDTLVASSVRMTRESLQAWIANPDQVKPGSLMPAMQLDQAELDQLVSYLATLH